MSNKIIRANDIEIILAKPNRSTVARLKDVTSVNLTLKEEEVHSLTFSVPSFITVNNKTVKNPHLDNLRGRFLIKTTFNKKVEWFLINEVGKIGDVGTEVQINCFSLPYQLQGHPIFDYDKQVNCLMAVNDALKGVGGWKPGYINPDFNLKYRKITFSQHSSLSFIYEIRDTFDAVVKFNSVDMTVNFYTREELYNYQGFSVRYGKYIESIKESIDSDKIITRLYVTGSDGMKINSVNPTGQPYIDDFSYYLYPFEQDEHGNIISHSNYMSDELCVSLIKYNNFVSDNSNDFSDLLEQKTSKQKELTVEENKLVEAEVELKIILNSITIAKKNSQPTASLIQERKQKNSEITSLKNTIKNINDEIEDIEAQIEALKNKLQIESFLSEEEQVELQGFIKFEDWSDDNQFDANDLYEAGYKRLQEVNQPPVDLELALVNFLQMVGEKFNWDRFNIGDTVRIGYEHLGIETRARLSEINLDFSSSTIGVTVSNSDDSTDVIDQFRDMMYTINKKVTELNKRKTDWEKVAYNFNIRNDRISEKPNDPILVSTPLSHEPNDDGSVNLELEWEYSSFDETEDNKDNIDGFLVYLYHSGDSEKYQFGSSMSSEVVNDVSFSTRAFTFPSVPANRYYTVGIRAYRRVDSDINREGILLSDLVYLNRQYSPETFGLMSAASSTNTVSNDEDEEGLFTPYQPQESVTISNARVNGTRPFVGEKPQNPQKFDTWINEDHKMLIYDGESWGESVDLTDINNSLGDFKVEVEQLGEEFDKELEESKKAVDEAMKLVEEEMKRLEDEVQPKIDEAIRETEIPSQGEPPEEIPQSGLWRDTSEDPPRLKIWDEEAGDWVNLAPTGDEIDYMMQQMRDGAVVEAQRYSKIDIMKTRNRILDQLNEEIGDVHGKIEELEDMRDDLVDLAENIDEILDEYGDKFTSFEHTIDELEGSVETVITDIERVDGVVEANTSSIEQNAELIESKVSSTEYERDKTDILSSIESNESSITQLSDEVELRVTKEEFDNLEIGGTNLIIIEQLLGDRNFNASTGELQYTNNAVATDYQIPIGNHTKMTASRKPGTLNQQLDNERFDFLRAVYLDEENEVVSIQEHGEKTPPLTFDVPSSSKYVRFSSSRGDLRNIKIEFGNKPTSFSPAPEDALERITKTEATLTIHADSIEQKAEKSELINFVDKQEYTEKVGSLTTSIDGITGTVQDIEADVDKNTGDITRASSKIGDLEITADDITSTVSRLGADVDTANEAISSVKQTADGIVSTVSGVRTDLDDVEAGMKANKSSIEQLPNQINLAVTEGIEDLEIGGRNLLVQGEFLFNTALGSDNGIPTNTNNANTTHFIEVEGSKSITSSRKIGTVNGVNEEIHFDYFRWAFYKKDKSLILVDDTGASGVNPPLTIVVPNNAHYARFSSSRGDLYNLKVEFGNKATDWTPAPEDGVNKTNVLSSINLSTEGVKIQGAKIDIQGLVSILNADGSTGTMIDGGKIVGQSITANKLNVNNIFGNSAVIAKIQADSVKTAKLSAGQIDTGTLNAARIGALSITSAKIAAGAIITSKIDAGAVNADKLAANSVIANKIAANAVTTAKINANAVVADKIAANAITAGKIASNAVTANKINAKAVTSGKIDVDTLSAISANMGTITAGSIDANSVTISNNRVTIGNGEITIKRPDGAIWLQDGMVRDAPSVQGINPMFMGSEVQTSGGGTYRGDAFLVTDGYFDNHVGFLDGRETGFRDVRDSDLRSSIRIQRYYFVHSARYFVLTYRSATGSLPQQVANNLHEHLVLIYDSGGNKLVDISVPKNTTETIELVVDMGTPSFSNKWLDFRIGWAAGWGGKNDYIRFRINGVVQTDFI